MTSNLTVEEKDILDSYERGEWESVSDVEEEKKRITNIFLESKKHDKKMISFSIDIDLVEWLNSKAPEEKRHAFINKALRAYIASLEETRNQEP